jgi:hypothetical protein
LIFMLGFAAAKASSDEVDPSNPLALQGLRPSRDALCCGPKGYRKP